MARYAVYVNNHDPKVRLHLEKNGPCSDLFQNIEGNGVYPIEVLDDGTIKTGKTDKLKFWLLVWVPDVNLDQVETIVRQNKHIKKAEGDVGKKLDLCKHCK